MLFLLGLTSANGWPYLLWSGFAAHIPSIITLLLVARRLNCHTHGCWRMGRHHSDNDARILCRHHHQERDASS